MPEDPSIINKSDGKQKSTIQREKYKSWEYKFDLASGEAGSADFTADEFENMWDDQGKSKELVILEKPMDSFTSQFTNPENHFYYVCFTRYNYQTIAGRAWKVNLAVEEEL